MARARGPIKGGHEVMLSFARDIAGLEAAGDPCLGLSAASVGSPAEAVLFGDVVIFAVGWSVIPEALAQAGDLAGTVVIDTTNQFGSGPMPSDGQTAASFNAALKKARATSSPSARSPRRSRPRRRGATATRES